MCLIGPHLLWFQLSFLCFVVVVNFRELDAIGSDEAVMTQSDDPLVVDIYTDFSTCMRNFQNETKVLIYTAFIHMV